MSPTEEVMEPIGTPPAASSQKGIAATQIYGIAENPSPKTDQIENENRTQIYFWIPRHQTLSCTAIKLRERNRAGTQKTDLFLSRSTQGRLKSPFSDRDDYLLDTRNENQHKAHRRSLLV